MLRTFLNGISHKSIPKRSHALRTFSVAAIEPKSSSSVRQKPRRYIKYWGSVGKRGPNAKSSQSGISKGKGDTSRRQRIAGKEIHETLKQYSKSKEYFGQSFSLDHLEQKFRPAQYTLQQKNVASRLPGQGCTFLGSFTSLEQLPTITNDLSWVAFVGRSNAGKSSLLRALLRDKKIVRTSKTPGHTQHMNFFRLGRNMVEGLCLVDLPGYGFARAPGKIRSAFQSLVNVFVQGDKVSQLKRTMVLIDSRRGVMPVDIEILKSLEKSKMKYEIVLTKTDKLNKTSLHIVQRKTLSQLLLNYPNCICVHSVSSKYGDGVGWLRNGISAAVQ
eukprot:GSMAST32.ASY1.ANO1.2674.1 assembled CDS